MDLRRLEVFAKVAELGSFSRAADALSLTQPTVSEHVRALEDELGVPLLDRLGRGATPTHAGRLLLGYARRMLALQREAQQALDQFQGRMSGELIVGGSTIPGEYVLPALIGRFKGKYPDISICLLIGSSRQVTEWVEAGRAEVGVVGAPPGPKTLLARELMAVALVSKRAVEDECRTGLLFCLRVHDLRVGRAFYLVTHRDRSRSPLAQAFVQFVESESPAEPS